MKVSVWSKWYEDNGKTDVRSQGLLPFRVWQFFDEMVKRVENNDAAGFLCAAGVVSHYTGDACQPLHGSYLADGYKNSPDATDKKWPGKGVHSTYEDKMVDRHSQELLEQIGLKAAAFQGGIPTISDGRDAAFATVKLMDYVANMIEPSTLCDEYIRLGGGTSVNVVDGLWTTFGENTAVVMGAGARYLAALWEAAFEKAGASTLDGVGVIEEQKLASIYQDKNFVPSLTLKEIGPVLE